jgi:hypothetical protein
MEGSTPLQNTVRTVSRRVPVMTSDPSNSLSSTEVRAYEPGPG